MSESNPAPPPAEHAPLRELLYLDLDRALTLTSQLGADTAPPAADPPAPPNSPAGRTHLHHHLEQSLAARGTLLDIGPSFDYSRWQNSGEGSFQDGQLVRASGMIRILDYPWLASVMETMPRMLKVMHRSELSALKQKREAHQVTQAEVDQKVKEHQSQLKDLETWRMDELTEVVRELFGQSVRIKLLPYGSKGGEMLVGSCLRNAFLEPPALLSQNYGTDINAGWSLLGILNLTPAAPVPPLATGNAVEDMFERLALAVNRIHRVASAPDFPALSITPIAIYRPLART
jgi:hypothetical protein